MQNRKNCKCKITVMKPQASGKEIVIALDGSRVRRGTSDTATRAGLNQPLNIFDGDRTPCAESSPFHVATVSSGILALFLAVVLWSNCWVSRFATFSRNSALTVRYPNA